MMLGFNPADAYWDNFGLYTDPRLPGTAAELLMQERTQMGWVFTGGPPEEFSPGDFDPGPGGISLRHLYLYCNTGTHQVIVNGSIGREPSLIINDAIGPVGVNYESDIDHPLIDPERVLFIAAVSDAYTPSFKMYVGNATTPATEVTYAVQDNGTDLNLPGPEDNIYFGETSGQVRQAWGPSTLVPRLLSVEAIRDFQWRPRLLAGARYWDPGYMGNLVNPGGITISLGDDVTVMNVDSLTTNPFVFSGSPGFGLGLRAG